jgi:heme exporter protein D
VYVFYWIATELTLLAMMIEKWGAMMRGKDVMMLTKSEKVRKAIIEAVKENKENDRANVTFIKDGHDLIYKIY